MNKESIERSVGAMALPLIGAGAVVLLWSVASATFAEMLPSPLETWEASRLYVLEPFEKRGELDQGILRFTWYSLERVTQGSRRRDFERSFRASAATLAPDGMPRVLRATRAARGVPGRPGSPSSAERRCGEATQERLLGPPALVHRRLS